MGRSIVARFIVMAVLAGQLHTATASASATRNTNTCAPDAMVGEDTFCRNGGDRIDFGEVTSVKACQDKVFAETKCGAFYHTNGGSQCKCVVEGVDCIQKGSRGGNNVYKKMCTTGTTLKRDVAADFTCMDAVCTQEECCMVDDDGGGDGDGDDDGSGFNDELRNPSFETGGMGWQGQFKISQEEQWAAPDGNTFALLSKSGSLQQTIEQSTITAGVTYTLNTWVRSANPRGNAQSTRAKVSLKTHDGTVLGTSSVTVGPSTLRDENGKKIIGDDGANIWHDGNYRLHMAQGDLYSQPLEKDPIHDRWDSVDRDCDAACDGMGEAPIVNPALPFKATYSTWYVTDDDSKDPFSRIDQVKLSGNAPKYNFPEPSGEDAAGDNFNPILTHDGDESPWAIDAHIFFDQETGKLWMTWGGYHAWITELDPVTGRIKGLPSHRSSTEFTSHPADMHHRVLSWAEWKGAGAYPASSTNPPEDWEGDAMSSQAYMEGPSLFKQDGRWFACGSYGSMGESYTIRCCRSDATGGADPTGMFVDKSGQGCTTFDAKNNRFGASMLLADDADHLVPGHPHMWQEPSSGKYYMGYDYRSYPGDGVTINEDNPIETDDLVAIQEIHFLNGWPTVWTPLTVELTVDEQSPAVGKAFSIVVELGDDSSSGAMLAVDMITLTESHASTGQKTDRGGNKLADHTDAISSSSKVGTAGKAFTQVLDSVQEEPSSPTGAIKDHTRTTHGAHEDPSTIVRVGAVTIAGVLVLLYVAAVAMYIKKSRAQIYAVRAKSPESTEVDKIEMMEGWIQRDSQSSTTAAAATTTGATTATTTLSPDLVTQGILVNSFDSEMHVVDLANVSSAMNVYVKVP